MEKMSSTYVREKLWLAVHVLVTGDGGLQERLASAGIGLIGLPKTVLLSTKNREAFDSIIQGLTKEPALGNEGRLVATSRKMSDEEAKRIADEILNLYTKLRGGM
jgi:hypothetical protein